MNKLFIITILFVFFATSSSNVIPRQIKNSLQLCNSGKNYPVRITKLNYNPDPIVIGQALKFDVAGTTQAQINQNTILQIQVKVIFIPISYKLDFCNEVLKPSVPPGSQLCPIPVGNFSYQGSVNVPNRPEIRNLNGARVTITLLSPDNTELTCLEGSIQIS